jgi:hypothetical protein
MSELEEERRIAETRKFVEESHKLIAESHKFGAEREKLFQEALKLERERWWFVPLAILSNGALAAIIGAVVAHLWR